MVGGQDCSVFTDETQRPKGISRKKGTQNMNPVLSGFKGPALKPAAPARTHALVHNVHIGLAGHELGM